MTWYRLTYLQCDADDCTTGYLSQVHDEGMRVTRTKAGEKGWRLWEGRDFCPEHAATGIPRIRVRALTKDEQPNDN